MLKRVLIDNFRCFSNFEFRPSPHCLIIGENGSGKSSFLEALFLLRSVAVDGVSIDESFPLATRTRWRTDANQTFELEVALPGGNYRYTMVLDRVGQNERARAASEKVSLDGKDLFLFESGEIHLFNDRFEDKVHFPFDWHRSGLATVQSRPDNQKLMAFREWFSTLLLLRPHFLLSQGSIANGESGVPGYHFQSFMNWYLNSYLEKPVVNSKFVATLSQVIPDLVALKFQNLGPGGRLLKAELQTPGSEKPYELLFEELSDGQRLLAALYSVLYFALADGRTAIIDEPDNFVALREIQPWLLELEREQSDSGQHILLSHHPEMLDNYALEDIFRFRRVAAGVVRAEPIKELPASDLPLKELIARGWLDE